MIGKKTRPLELAAVLSALAVAAIAAPGTNVAAARATAAAPLLGQDARALSVNDTGHLHLLKAFGSVLLEEGAAGGTLPGLAKVRLLVGSTVIASFTIQTKSGTIYGSGRAALHSSGRYASFGGSLSVSHGTGSYARAHGSGKLYGVIDRRTSSLTVQTVGTLSY
jgi:hypothetical protein